MSRNHVARFAFQLAQSFNTFYHDYPVNRESDETKRAFLLWLTTAYRQQIERTLSILGIQVPAFM